MKSKMIRIRIEEPDYKGFCELLPEPGERAALIRSFIKLVLKQGPEATLLRQIQNILEAYEMEQDQKAEIKGSATNDWR